MFRMVILLLLAVQQQGAQGAEVEEEFEGLVGGQLGLVEGVHDGFLLVGLAVGAHYVAGHDVPDGGVGAGVVGYLNEGQHGVFAGGELGGLGLGGVDLVLEAAGEQLDQEGEAHHALVAPHERAVGVGIVGGGAAEEVLPLGHLVGAGAYGAEGQVDDDAQRLGMLEAEGGELEVVVFFGGLSFLGAFALGAKRCLLFFFGGGAQLGESGVVVVLAVEHGEYAFAVDDQGFGLVYIAHVFNQVVYYFHLLPQGYGVGFQLLDDGAGGLGAKRWHVDVQ